ISLERNRKKCVRKNEGHPDELPGLPLAAAWKQLSNRTHGSERNSYSSMTAATATLPSESPASTRTTLPLHRTRMLSVKVISGGSVRVNSMADPAVIAESTKKQIPRALTSRVCA